MIHPRNLVESDNSRAERSRAILELDGFSSRRIRLEYIIFWFRVYFGYWPISKIIFQMTSSFIRAYPNIYSKLLFLRNKSAIFSKIVAHFSSYDKGMKVDKRKYKKTIGTRVDVVAD